MASPRPLTSPGHNALSSSRHSVAMPGLPRSASRLSITSQRTTSRLSHRSVSRQSATSLDKCVATAIAECDPVQIESAFERRWEAEQEMEKQLKAARQKQLVYHKLKRWNDIHSRLLERQLQTLQLSYSQASRELTKEARHFQEEFEESFGTENTPVTPANTSTLSPATPATNTSTLPPVPLRRIDSTTSAGSRASSSLSARSSWSRSLSREPPCHTCIYDRTSCKSKCRHFPCCLPRTYNSLGMFPKPQTYSVVRNYNQLLARCKDIRPPTSKHQSRDPDVTYVEKQTIFEEESKHAPRTTVKEKLRGLKQLVKEMKERNEKTKPKDWAVNYGDPVPRRIILKPVIKSVS